MKQRMNPGVRTVLGLAIISGLCGCGRDIAEKPQATDVQPTELSDAAVAKLAMADAHDGTVDNIIEDCAACKLHMKGKPEITAVVGDYTFHCCAERCREVTLTNPEKILAALPDE